MSANALATTTILQELRDRADDDFLSPAVVKTGGRHQVDLPEVGLRVSLTRSLYPARAGGVDTYALTISRLAMDHAPADAEIEVVLAGLFGQRWTEVEERRAGPLVRMFRLVASDQGNPRLLA